jgi:acetolactate synthase small subunit
MGSIFYFLVLTNKGEFIMEKDFGEFDFGGVNRNNNKNGESFDRQGFKQKLSGTFTLRELTGDEKKRGKFVGKPVEFEKPSALIKANKAKEQSKENKGFLKSIWAMFHGDDTKERKMTISSRNTVEEIKEQLEKLYDRIKEYEEKLEDKSKEISSKLIDLKKKIVSLDDKIRRSRRRINLYEKQIRGYETDLEKIKDKGNFMKQSIIDGKIKDLNFEIREEQKKIEDFESKLEPFGKQKESLENKKSEIEKSLANLKKKSVAIDQKLGRSSVSKESTFEILRRSIKENARRREIEPSQVSNENRAFRTTWNSKTYSFGNPEALKNLSDLSIKGRALEGLGLARRQKTWLEQQLEKVDKRVSELKEGSSFNDRKERGGKDFNR